MTLPYMWLGKEAESAEVLLAYYPPVPPVPLVVVDDTEEME